MSVPSGATLGGEVLSRLGATLARYDSPEDAIHGFHSTLVQVIPGLRLWILEKDPATSVPHCMPIPSQEECPFPDSVRARPDATIARVLRTGETVEVSAENGPVPRCAEAPYLRRSRGTWWFVPLPDRNPVAVALLNHAEGTPRDGFRETLFGALRLVQPHVALLAGRRAVEHRVAQRTSELTLFYETSRSLALAKSAEEISSLLGHHLGPALGLEMIGLLNLRQDRPELLMEVIGASGAGSIRSFRRRILKEARASGSGRESSVRTRINRPARISGGAPSPGRACIHVPLQGRDRTLGFLSAAAREGMGESRVRLLNTVAGQTALTLERVQIVEQASLLKIRSVLESMSEGVLLVDRSLEVTMANPAAEQLARAILGAPMGRRLHRLGTMALAPLMEALASSGATAAPLEIPSEDSERLFQLTVSPARGGKGIFEGLVIVISDVTQQRRIQEQLMQSDKLSSLGEMISGVAHELNNPLTSIMGFSQLLGRGSMEKDVRRKVEAINNEATRCQKIVENLLQFARRKPPQRTLVDLNTVIGTVNKLLGYQLQADNIIVDVQLDQRMRSVHGDPHLLQQVFVNLVSNAHHAMNLKGGRGVLRVTTFCDGLTCRIEVSDTGPGIPVEHMKKIFDPFFTTKDVGQGTGLGLSIAYGAVTDHGGRIFARSKAGQGTTFVVELPVAQSAMVEAGDTAAAEAVEQPHLAARRILVVDDETTLSEMLCEALAAEGHEVDYAADGLSAREKLGRQTYDLIISDLKMPRMGGRELYAEVRQSNPALARRIIFSTGDSVSPDTEAFFRETGNPHLTKPFNLRDLFNVINTTLREV